MMTTPAEKAAMDKRICDLAAANNGEVTPDMVWQDAQDPDSPLRKAFEWDKDAAWNKHNLQVARTLIASVTIKVTLTNTTIKIPQFTHDPSLPQKTQGYIDVQQVQQMNQTDLAKQIISQELGRTRQALSRAQGYASHFKMDADIEQLTIDIQALEDRLKAA
jgi:hypothetical protein